MKKAFLGYSQSSVGNNLYTRAFIHTSESKEKIEAEMIESARKDFPGAIVQAFSREVTLAELEHMVLILKINAD